MVFQEFLYKQSAPVIAKDLEAVSFIFSMHSKYINMNVGNSNNLLRDLSAISSTRNIFLVSCNSHKDKLFWKCIHLRISTAPLCCMFHTKWLHPETWMVFISRGADQISGKGDIRFLLNVFVKYFAKSFCGSFA